MDRAMEARGQLLEALAEVDEPFMEIYLQAMEDDKDIKLSVRPAVPPFVSLTHF